jgi:hypothetical protein
MLQTHALNVQFWFRQHDGVQFVSRVGTIVRAPRVQASVPMRGPRVALLCLAWKHQRYGCPSTRRLLKINGAAMNVHHLANYG